MAEQMMMQGGNAANGAGLQQNPLQNPNQTANPTPTPTPQPGPTQ
jgi:hypothetical protein